MNRYALLTLGGAGNKHKGAGLQSKTEAYLDVRMNTRLTRLITCCLLGSGVVSGQDAAIVLERMQTALGGPRLLQVRDIDWTVKAKVWDGAGHEAGFATRRQRVILPHQSRKDQNMHVANNKVLHTRYYFDGKSGWGSFADMVKL
jgi:hypothetical protein